MKKLFFTLFFVLGSIALISAQPRTIGARLGYGIDVSYQHTLQNNMINLEVSAPSFGGIFAACTYDWVFPIKSWEHDGKWNWYAGVGAGLGYQFWTPDEDDFNQYFGVGVAGRIGVEYNFWFPLQLSLDWRPIIGPAISDGEVRFCHESLYSGAIALGVRYIF